MYVEYTTKKKIVMLKLVIFLGVSFILILKSDTRGRSWLGHCAANRKAAGSFPDGLIGIFLPAALWPRGRIRL